MVGEIVDDTYVTVRGLEHFFRVYHGYGISKKVLNQLDEHKVSKIRLVYNNKLNGKQVVYDTTVTRFRLYGIEHLNNLDVNDEQLILPLKFWNCPDSVYVREDDISPDLSSKSSPELAEGQKGSGIVPVPKDLSRWKK